MADELRVGLWLGTQNRVRHLRRLKRGWRLTDTTGAVYDQSVYPEGLRATEDVEPDVSKRPRVRWPA